MIELYNDVPTGTYGSDRYLELYASDCRWREMPSAYAPEGRGSDHGLDHATVARAAAVFLDPGLTFISLSPMGIARR